MDLKDNVLMVNILKEDFAEISVSPDDIELLYMSNISNSYAMYSKLMDGKPIEMSWVEIAYLILKPSANKVRTNGHKLFDDLAENKNITGIEIIYKNGESNTYYTEWSDCYDDSNENEYEHQQIKDEYFYIAIGEHPSLEWFYGYQNDLESEEEISSED